MEWCQPPLMDERTSYSTSTKDKRLAWYSRRSSSRTFLHWRQFTSHCLFNHASINIIPAIQLNRHGYNQAWFQQDGVPHITACKYSTSLSRLYVFSNHWIGKCMAQFYWVACLIHSGITFNFVPLRPSKWEATQWGPPHDILKPPYTTPAWGWQKKLQLYQTTAPYMQC